MVRAIDIIEAIDRAMDAIPILGTATNVGILLYQQIHKVNRVANPVRTSWVDDLKIYALSKGRFTASLAAFHLLGLLVLFFSMCSKL